MQSLAVFYGQNRPDYYLTEGLPLLLTTAFPFAAMGWWQAIRGTSCTQRSPTTEQLPPRSLALLRSLGLIALALPCILSLISHKEVRFIYPLLPILHVLAAPPLAAFFAPFPAPASLVKRTLLLALLAFNVALAAYASLVHQRGVVDVTHYLRHEYEARQLELGKDAALTGAGLQTEARIMTAAFLMPCHSTPWRSHLVHPGIEAWALTCEPPLHVPLSQRSGYLDEADVFYADPGAWMAENMAPIPGLGTQIGKDKEAATKSLGGKRAWPDYLVFFEQLLPEMAALLEGSRYSECWRGFSSHFHDDWRRKGDVVVWCDKT